LLWRAEENAGRNIILLLFLIAWAADTGAYAFGRLIGGPKLAPVLSPNKTWAGFIGGVFCAALVGAGFALFIKESGLMILTISAVILGIISQCGDLLESRIKRLFQVKDAGSLIPGHGGLLDRVDSLLAMSWAIGLLYWIARDEVLKWI
jgi:phosphatidate cytidylyltransferase